MRVKTPGRQKNIAAWTNALDTFARRDGVQKLQLKIGGMSCSFCVASIEKAMGRMDGVRKVNVNLAHEEVMIEYEPVGLTLVAFGAMLLAWLGVLPMSRGASAWLLLSWLMTTLAVTTVFGPVGTS